MLEFKWGGISRKQVDAKAYSEVTKEVGKELGIPVVDVWSAFMEKAGWKEGTELQGTTETGKNTVLQRLLYDGKFIQIFRQSLELSVGNLGIHLAPDGYRIVFDELLKVLKENWPQYPPYTMPFKVTLDLPWEVENAKAAQAALN